MADIHDVIDVIYEQAAGNGDWRQPLSMIQDLVSSKGAFFTGHDIVGGKPTFRLSSRGLIATEDDYDLKMYRANERIKLLLKHPTGSSITGGELTTDADFERSAFYLSFMKQHDLFHTGGTILENNYLKALTFGAIREKSAGDFTSAEMKDLSILARHAHRALKVREVIEDRDAAYRVRDELADKINAGMFTLDREGRVLATNVEADAVLNDLDGVSIVKDRLAFEAPTANAHLRHILYSQTGSGMEEADDDPPPNMFGVNRPSGETPYWVTWMPATDTRSILTSHFSGLPQPAVLVFVTDSARRWTVSIDTLKEHFGLTDREACIVAALVSGETTEEIGRSHEISINTIKTHLKRIFDKTGTASQIALVRLVLRAHAVVS